MVYDILKLEYLISVVRSGNLFKWGDSDYPAIPFRLSKIIDKMPISLYLQIIGFSVKSPTIDNILENSGGDVELQDISASLKKVLINARLRQLMLLYLEILTKLRNDKIYYRAG
jgi:hypothetical protein